MRISKYQKNTALFLLLVVSFLLSVNNSYAENQWQLLLTKYVTDGQVDYHGFHKDKQKLEEYLDLLNRTNPNNLNQSEQLAYYINAYNSCTIKLIIDNSKIEDGRVHFVTSIKDIGSLFSSPWKKRNCELNGNTYNLDEIEHELIRKQFNDPRIHFALNCASKSCPPLASQAYDASKLDRQLDRQSKRFINDKSNNYIRGKTLYASKIFSWYEDDFQPDSIAFFKLFAEGKLKTDLEKNHAKLDIKFLPYDWSLNN
ncbi:MAG: DUF547 domain-containing protein [Desulfotalea sp.]